MKFANEWRREHVIADEKVIGFILHSYFYT